MTHREFFALEYLGQPFGAMSWLVGLVSNMHKIPYQRPLLSRPQENAWRDGDAMISLYESRKNDLTLWDDVINKIKNTNLDYFKYGPTLMLNDWMCKLLLHVHMGLQVPKNGRVFIPLLIRPHMPVDIKLRFSKNRKRTSLGMWPWSCFFQGEEDIHTYMITALAPRMADEDISSKKRVISPNLIRLSRGPPLLWYPFYVASLPQKITLDSPFVSVPFVYNWWEHDYMERSNKVKSLFKKDAAELQRLYDSAYGKGHLNGFVKDLLLITYKFLLYSEPKKDGWEYVELGDVIINLNNLNWFKDSHVSQATKIDTLSVEDLFAKTSPEDRIRASITPYTTRVNVDDLGNVFIPNKTLITCVEAIFKPLYARSSDKRDTSYTENGPYVKLMLPYEFIMARAIPALIDTPKPIEPNFWIAAIDAACCLYAMGPGVIPDNYYERLCFTRFVAAFTGTFWALDIHKWTRNNWFSFVINPGNMISQYYKHIRPDITIEEILGNDKIAIYPESRDDMLTAINSLLPLRYVEFIRNIFPGTINSSSNDYRTKSFDEFIEVTEKHKWLESKCKQTYLQCFYYPSKKHSLKYTFFHNLLGLPNWLQNADANVMYVNKDDDKAHNMTSKHIVWTAIQHFRQLVESNLNFKDTSNLDTYLGKFAKTFFKQNQWNPILNKQYTRLHITDEEYMELFLVYRHTIKCEQIHTVENKRVKRNANLGHVLRFNSQTLYGLLATAIEMSRRSVTKFALIVRKYLDNVYFNPDKVKYNAAIDAWCMENGEPIPYDFQIIENENVKRQATIHDVVCEMLMGSLEAFAAFSLLTFDVQIQCEFTIPGHEWLKIPPSTLHTPPLEYSLNEITEYEILSTGMCAIPQELKHTTPLNTWEQVIQHVRTFESQIVLPTVPESAPYTIPLVYILAMLK